MYLYLKRKKGHYNYKSVRGSEPHLREKFLWHRRCVKTRKPRYRDTRNRLHDSRKMRQKMTFLRTNCTMWVVLTPALCFQEGERKRLKAGSLDRQNARDNFLSQKGKWHRSKGTTAAPTDLRNALHIYEPADMHTSYLLPFRSLNDRKEKERMWDRNRGEESYLVK